MRADAHILIRKGRVIDPATGRDEILDLLIENGRLARLGASLDAPGAEIFNAEGLWVLPGIVDTCVRLPGGGGRTGSIATETRAASSGGVTHMCALPDTDPVVDHTAMVRLIRERSRAANSTRVLPLGALTKDLEGTQLAEMHALREAGCIGVSNAGRPVGDSLILKRCLEYAATFDIPVMFRPQDAALAAGGCAHDGAVATRLGLPGIPGVAETLELARVLLLVRETGVKAHFHQLSSAGSLELIRTARASGLPVTADVSIHHLLLDESALENFDSHCHILPPLRGASDRQALVAAVVDGTVDAICSQHTPIGSACKAMPFPATTPGIAGVETLLPLVLGLVERGDLPLEQAVAALTCGAARSLGIAAGQLEEGRLASVCVVDPNRRRRPGDAWQSAGRNSPWLDIELPGVVCLTVSEGRVTWRQP